MRRIRIALLAGGWSTERNVSLKSGAAVYRTLDKEKYDVVMYDPLTDLRDLMEARGKVDLAFILLHGKFGEDGCIQGLLDMLRIPYVGSGVLSSAMAMNKKVAKEIYKHAGLTVGKDIVLKHGDDFSVNEIIAMLGTVTVVKPIADGSSLGISLCENKKELLSGIEKAFRHGDEVMVEKYINGREVTCCVLGTGSLQALPLVEILPGDPYRFFDHEAKYKDGATREICPASLSQPLTEKIQEYAKSAHRALKCSVWSRTDMIIRNENIYLLETNTIPGMTENSLFPIAAAAAGISFLELLDMLIMFSLTPENCSLVINKKAEH